MKKTGVWCEKIKLKVAYEFKNIKFLPKKLIRHMFLPRM